MESHPRRERLARSSAGPSSTTTTKANELPRKPVVRSEPVDPEEFRRVTRSQGRSPTKSTPKKKTESVKDKKKKDGPEGSRPTELDAFASVTLMPNPVGGSSSGRRGSGSSVK